MKTTTLLLSLLFTAKSFSQCGYGCNYRPTQVTFGVIYDLSIRQFPHGGFMGTGVHLGMWADHIGLFAGYVEYKLNEKTRAERVGAITMATRYCFFDDRLVTSAYFAAGTQNYQDYGLRVGWDIWNNGIAVGAIASRTMHYGLSVMISMHKSD